MPNISFAKIDQVDLIAEFELKSFFDEAYSKSTLLEILKDNYILLNNINIFTINLNYELIGYIIFTITIDYTDILKLFIRESDRYKGYATMLLNKVIDTANRYHSNKLMIEVRSNNTSAQKFYSKNGFINISTRKNYYHNPNDDALIFERKL